MRPDNLSQRMYLRAAALVHGPAASVCPAFVKWRERCHACESTARALLASWDDGFQYAVDWYTPEDRY